MSIIPSLPVTLQNGTTADATQVMADFNSIVTNVNNNAANNGLNSNITSLTGLTTPLSTSQGGTGIASPPANCVLVSEGSGAFMPVGPGLSGQPLVSNGSGSDPSFRCPYRIGDLYFSTISANPSTFLGGTWAAYAAGQVLIGVGSFTDGNSTNKTIAAGQQLGEYQHTLVTNEMPSHTHPDSGHVHGHGMLLSAPGTGQNASGSPNFIDYANTQTGYANLQNTGGGGAHNNIQPSIGVYVWQRTA